MSDSDEYRMGFFDGFKQALLTITGEDRSMLPRVEDSPKERQRKRKLKQSPKQKLLTQMTKKKWDKYKKGKGKKSYVEIRAQVSRSQEFKRKSKRL